MGKVELAFNKEFLLENEKDQNWTMWDRCRINYLTLNQYVAKYQEVILKIDGLDDLQKLRGFICGLDKEYQAKVKTQYPKTLKDTIKNALIFDDALDKRGGSKTLESSQSQTGVNPQQKRKFPIESSGSANKEK